MQAIFEKNRCEQSQECCIYRQPPWETAPSGVVSLLDMLKFAAEDFWEASGIIGHVLENRAYVIDHKARAVNSIAKLMAHCKRLGLAVSAEHIKKVHADYEAGGSDEVLVERFRSGMTSLAAVIHSELAGKQFLYIEATKTPYCDSEWLTGTLIQANFPRAFGEFRSAGRCYAYGENTACAFHLNRVLEDGLKSLATTLGLSFNKNSWDAHLKDISRELESRYKAAGARTPDEKFYSDLASQFGHMKTAWRNPTMHVESRYDERDALYLLQATERFVEGLCDRGLQQGDLI